MAHRRKPGGSIRITTLAAFAIFLAALAIYGDTAFSATQYPDRGMGGLRPKLVSMLYTVQKHYGRKVIVVSGCRSRTHNRRIGGARESYHLRCMAADIIVPGVARGRLLRFLQALPGRGGVGRYCRSHFVHIDIGPRREWSWGCGGRRKVRLAKRR